MEEKENLDIEEIMYSEHNKLRQSKNLPFKFKPHLKRPSYMVVTVPTHYVDYIYNFPKNGIVGSCDRLCIRPDYSFSAMHIKGF